VAHYPISDPDSHLESASSLENRPAEATSAAAGKTVSFESNLVQLAAQFSSDAGGQLPADLSADLALEIVLHEIVEQACAATGASGAAVILERDGEWVCRASSGTGAPELGARLGRDSGLTAECIRIRQVQRCDDIEKDPRVDIDACRSLGVRSIIMLPLMQGEKPIGVFGAFSPSLSAFGEAEERDLKALSDEVIRNLALASEPQPATEKVPGKVSAPPSALLLEIGADSPRVLNFPNENLVDEKPVAAEPGDQFEARPETPQSESLQSGTGFKIATWILTAVVLAFAVFLTVVASQRLLGRKITRGNPSIPSQSPGDVAQQAHQEDMRQTTPATDTAGNNRPVSNGSSSIGASTASRSPDSLEVDRAGTEAKESAADPAAAEAGSLTVYEGGKEVFHLPGASTRDSNAPVGPAENLAHTPASAVQSQRIYELSPTMAQDELLLRVDPAYPEQAREREVEGIVVLNVRAGRDGRVRDVRLVGGQPLLVGAAIAAVKQWQFKPHLVNGQPVETQTRITLTFELPRAGH
jgi:TonB family protein